jgi:hypothetical protein
MALKSETYVPELVREHAKVLGEDAPIRRPIVQLVSRGRELHRYTTLPKISLHQLPSRPVPLREPSRIKHGFFQTRPRQRLPESCDIGVEVGIVRVERRIELSIASATDLLILIHLWLFV